MFFTFVTVQLSFFPQLGNWYKGFIQRNKRHLDKATLTLPERLALMRAN